MGLQGVYEAFPGFQSFTGGFRGILEVFHGFQWVLGGPSEVPDVFQKILGDFIGVPRGLRSRGVLGNLKRFLGSFRGFNGLRSENLST